MERALFCMALAASARVMPAANARDAAGTQAGDASDPKPSEDELARFKQHPVSGLRQVQFVAVVGPNTQPSGKTAGAYSLQVVWPFKLPDPDYRRVTYSILPVFQVPPETPDDDTTVGLGDARLSAFVAPTKSGSFVWGLGSTATLPTRSNDILGSSRVGLGPAGVLFYEQPKWSVGVVLQNL